MGWVVNVTPQSLYLQEEDLISILQEAGWAPEMVWMCAENFAPTRI